MSDMFIRVLYIQTKLVLLAPRSKHDSNAYLEVRIFLMLGSLTYQDFFVTTKIQAHMFIVRLKTFLLVGCIELLIGSCSSHFVYTGKLNVIPGNTISVSLSESPSESRAFVFEIAQEVIKKHGTELGFDTGYHQLVIPRTPYKPGTTEHWPGKGAHITIALHNRTRNIREETDYISQAMTSWKDHLYKIILDRKDPLLLLGKPENDEAVGAVYYLAIKVDDGTVNRIQTLRK